MYKKILAAASLAAFVSPAYADILVILPESGAMARASQSIKRGFLSAYTASGSKEKIIFVDSAKNSIDTIFKKLNHKTKLIVGPLARN
jgi:outer membrane PBP1 activator LpoA protein